MKHFLFFLSLAILSSCVSQRPITRISGIDPIPGVIGEPKFHIIQTYYDFLEKDIMPQYLLIYYDNLDENDFANINVTIDTTVVVNASYAARNYITTRKAKDGYLSINKRIMEIVNANKGKIKNVVYMLAGDTISGSNIKRLLLLGKGAINEIDISVQENTLTIRIH